MEKVTVKRKKVKIEILFEGKEQITLSVEEARKLSTELLQLGIEIEDIGDQVGEWQRIPMQYIAFEVSNELRTAEVSCWIKDQTKRNALVIAMADVEKIEWNIENLLEHEETTIEEYEEDEESLKYYEQALVDGEVYVIYDDLDA